MTPSDFDVTKPEAKWWEALATKKAALDAEYAEFWNYAATSRGISEGAKMTVDWKALRLTVTLPEPNAEEA